MHDIKVVDESFDIKFATQYNISIQVGLDGFSFCILDTHSNKYVYFQHIPLIVGKLQFLAKKVVTIYEQEEILNSNFKNVSVNFSTNKSSFIPTEFSEPAYINQVANFTNSINRLEDVSLNTIPGFNYQLIYSYPKELIAFFNRKYTDFKFRHKSVSLIAASSNQINSKKKTLLIMFRIICKTLTYI